MKNKMVLFAFVALIFSGCNNSNKYATPKAQISKDMNELYDSQQGTPKPIEWNMLPGGELSDVNNFDKYCVIVNMEWRDINSIAAIICSKTSDVLIMLIANESKTDAVLHIDADGYTPYLELSRDTQNEPFNLYIEVSRPKSTDIDMYVAELPSLVGLKKQDLIFRKVDSIPTWGDTRPWSRDDFTKAMGIPAAIRIQGNEKLIYMYYVRKR